LTKTEFVERYLEVFEPLKGHDEGLDHVGFYVKNPMVVSNNVRIFFCPGYLSKAVYERRVRHGFHYHIYGMRYIVSGVTLDYDKLEKFITILRVSRKEWKQVSPFLDQGDINAAYLVAKVFCEKNETKGGQE